MIIRKRQLLMATLVLALGSAVFVNWYYTRTPALEAGSGTTAASDVTQAPQENLGDAQYVNSGTTDAQEAMKREYFASAKLRRTTAHAQAKEELQEIIGNKASDTDAIKAANTALADIARAIKQEGDIENLIQAKIGSECVVILNGNSAEAVVGKKDLNEQSALQIKEILTQQTKLPAESITIVELNS